MNTQNMLVKIFTIEIEYKTVFECDKFFNMAVIGLQ